MRYAFYIKPHPNIRYQQSLLKLALCELTCVLRSCHLPSESIKAEKINDEQFIIVEWNDQHSISDELWKKLSNLSFVCFIAEYTKEGLLRPLTRTRIESLFPVDMPHILKYKGKTNVDFTQLMIHCARSVCSYAESRRPLTLLDPMCSRGTTLFCALVEGYHAIGMDTDQKAITDGRQFSEHFMEWYHLKYRQKAKSLTLSPSGEVKSWEYAIGKDALSFKEDQTQLLTWIESDAENANRLLKHQPVDIIVCDLPYGVQHAPKQNRKIRSLNDMLSAVIPSCCSVLRTGGACAFSFNINTLSKDLLIQTMQSAGLTVLKELPDFTHWVEQAITRDLVIAVKST